MTGRKCDHAVSLQGSKQLPALLCPFSLTAAAFPVKWTRTWKWLTTLFALQRQFILNDPIWAGTQYALERERWILTGFLWWCSLSSLCTPAIWQIVGEGVWCTGWELSVTSFDSPLQAAVKEGDREKTEWVASGSDKNKWWLLGQRSQRSNPSPVYLSLYLSSFSSLVLQRGEFSFLNIVPARRESVSSQGVTHSWGSAIRALSFLLRLPTVYDSYYGSLLSFIPSLKSPCAVQTI